MVRVAGLEVQPLNTVTLVLLPYVANVRLSQLWRALNPTGAMEGCPTEPD